MCEKFIISYRERAYRAPNGRNVYQTVRSIFEGTYAEAMAYYHVISKRSDVIRADITIYNPPQWRERHVF